MKLLTHRIPKKLQFLRWAMVSLVAWTTLLQAQTTTYNFRRLTDAEGLSDGVVRCFTDDQYGFVWIGTSYGLNRFDGIKIKSYFSIPGDTTSLSNNYVQSLFTDSKQNIWIGTIAGLCRYDPLKDKFIRYQISHPVTVNTFVEDKYGKIWVGANDGLWVVDEKHHAVQKFNHPDQPELNATFKCLIWQIIATKNGDWCMATNVGVKIFNPYTNVFSQFLHHAEDPSSLSSNTVYGVAQDSSGYVWATCNGPTAILNKIDLTTRKITFYDHFTTGDKRWKTNTIQRILVDHKGRPWVIASYSGLSVFDAKQDTFFEYKNDPLIPNTLLSNQNISIFQSRDGVIWIGTGGYGLSYFHPDENLFFTVYPFLSVEQNFIDTWCRAVCDDEQGRIYLATGKGLAQYDTQWKLLKTFSNEIDKKPILHTNSVRSLLRDTDGNIWIGTAKGLNRYHPDTGVMDFFDVQQGMPLNFFWMMAMDHHGDVWFGSANGLYKYIRNENRFDNLRKDPVLAPYAPQNIQAIYADQHNQLWIGIMDIGLVQYNVDHPEVKLLTVKDSMISDTRFSSFAEDQDGWLWIGSEEGLVAYHETEQHSRFFGGVDGLPSNRTNSLLVDSLNRVWIGTSNGLCVLNEKRTKFKRFDVTDGLLTNHFNEQEAFKTRDGYFVYPTYKGFLIFKPENFKETHDTVPVYVSSFTVNDHEIAPNTMELKNLHLKHNENFFNIELAGLHFLNPHQCTYAYQLEPFDKDWIYTKTREIHYTNVPAGDYTFRYKAITDSPDWNVPEKTIVISINEVYHRTWWFRSLLLILIAAGVFSFYRFRMKQRESILILKGKAQLLEKEKTLVMYENLKQHLNPHFLFNSLTSLSSLIRVDQKMAGDFLDNMSKVYRYILKNRDNETVTLADELNFVNMHIQLQKTRFGDGLEVNVHVGEEYLYRKVAPVTLEGLVENAIKHNIADADSPLKIDIYTEDEYLVVRNNLQRKNFVETSNKQGLLRMKSLYQYLSARPLLIEENQKYFMVKIPLL